MDVRVTYSQDKNHSTHFYPKKYVIHKISEPIVVDGVPNESAWQAAKWTDPFLDIQGDHLPAPRFKTQAKMLWDDDFLYITALLEEPHTWAAIKKRNAVILRFRCR